MVGNGRSPLGGSLLGGLLLLIAVAAGARLVYDLLAPLLPILVALVVVAVLATVLFRR